MPGTAAQPSQSYYATFSDGIHSPRTVYFASPANVLTAIRTDFAVAWMS